MSIPSKVTEAIAEYRLRLPAHHYLHPLPATGQPGEIALARGGDVSSLILIHGSDDHHGRRFVNFSVCDNDIDMATDLDLILPATNNRPYRLVVYAELYAQIWVDQLVQHVDMITPAQHEGIRWSLGTDGESLADLEHGLLPLAGPVDPRWQHRHRMLTDVLMPLRNDCLSVLWDEL